MRTGGWSTLAALTVGGAVMAQPGADPIRVPPERIHAFIVRLGSAQFREREPRAENSTLSAKARSMLSARPRRRAILRSAIGQSSWPTASTPG
jgi:hypothetical protein